MISTQLSDSWGTPFWLYDQYDSIYRFKYDGAADINNTKTPLWFGPGGVIGDALEEEWPTDGNVWVNPPYSRGYQRAFVEAAIRNGGKGNCIVMLLPSDTSTILYHELIKPRFHQFLKGRVRFAGAPGPAKFGSLIVYFS